MKRQWTTDELIDDWTLTSDELGHVGKKTGATRLGFAVLLKYFQREGTFPPTAQVFTEQIVAFLAKQVGVPASLFADYHWGERTHEQHRAQIRTILGFREFSAEAGEAFISWLQQEHLPATLKPERLEEAHAHFCKTHGWEPPTADRRERLIRSAIAQFEDAFVTRTAARLSPAVEERLDALIQAEALASEIEEVADEPPPTPPRDATQPVTFHDLRTDPGPVGLESFLMEIGKLRCIRALEFPEALFTDAPPSLMERFRRRAGSEPPSALRAHTADLRFTLLACLLYQRSQEITDGLVELVIQLVHRLSDNAEHRVEKAYIKDIKKVMGKAKILAEIAAAATTAPDGKVRDVIFKVASEKKLKEIVAEYKANTGVHRQQVQGIMRRSYSQHYRKMLSPLLEMLTFRSNNEQHQPVIAAVGFIEDYVDLGAMWYPADTDPPLDGLLSTPLRDLVEEADSAGVTRVNRLNYELCVLGALRDRIRTKEIWVEGAKQYRNPEADLPPDFSQKRATYYEALKLPLAADTFIASVQAAMKAALTAFDRRLPKLTDQVKLITRKTKGYIRLAKLPPQKEPKHLERLKAEVALRWSQTSLLDILKETALLTKFTDRLTSVASREALPPAVLQKRLLLALYGLGTNTGLKRMAHVDQGTTYSDLRYIRRRYIHKEQLRAAIAEVVNATLRVRQSGIWGDATTSCASDSKKFGAFDQNLVTRWHARYRGPGVLIYWHVDKRSLCIYSQLKTCNSSEVAAMIEGVLHHCTDKQIEKQFVDSHGQSEVGFAFCHLLGFRLLPRLKPIHTQRLYRPETGHPEDYPNLQLILTRPINWDLIKQQYDQMMKYATALRLGTADADAILKRFTHQNAQHPTYLGLIELGKAIKTIFLCEYLAEERLRREMQEALNVMENWNSANGFIFYGRSGEISTNRTEDQEIAVLALHLLQNCLVFINTLMLQEVLAEEAWREKMKPADWRGLTPLTYSHVNPYGVFLLDMAKRLRVQMPAPPALAS